MANYSQTEAVQRARREHLAPLADRGAPRTKFDRTLLAYLDLPARTGATGLRDGRRAKMLAALNYEATWAQIKSWRNGRRQAPQWAIALLQTKIADRRNQLDALIFRV